MCSTQQIREVLVLYHLITVWLDLCISKTRAYKLKQPTLSITSMSKQLAKNNIMMPFSHPIIDLRRLQVEFTGRLAKEQTRRRLGVALKDNKTNKGSSYSGDI